MRKMIGLLATVLSTLALVLAVPIVATAAPAAPIIVAPDGTTTQTTPVLQWARVSGAVKYEVAVSTNAAFTGSLSFSQTTANTYATPLTDLQTGPYYWRVRAVDKNNAAGTYATAAFTRANDNAPVLTSPANGASLSYPSDETGAYHWDALAGAKSYEIQIDDDPGFVGAASPITVNATSYSPTSPPAFNTPVWWRVRAKSSTGVYSQWSDPWTFQVTWDASARVDLMSPPPTNAVPIEKVVLSWNPLPGSAFYQLDLSPDQNFNNPIYSQTKVLGNTFAPKATLQAGAYYWRVRPMSTSSVAEPGEWSDTWTFTKAWPATDPLAPRPGGTEDNSLAQVGLISPSAGDFTLDQPAFSWSPQRSAAYYQLDIGTDTNFSPGTYSTCSTNHTTFTPYNTGSGSCSPSELAAGTVAYWRVRAVDAYDTYSATKVYGAYSEVRSFLYDPAHIIQTAPSDGATVNSPILRWSEVPNISRYKVTIQNVETGCAVIYTATVWNTTYVPESLKSGCSGPWHWTVQGIEDDGHLTRLASYSAWPTFAVSAPGSATASAPSPVDATTLDAFRPPLLQWPAVTDADSYQVYASVANANSFVALGKVTSATAYAYTGENSSLGHLLPPGDYDYFVQAKKGPTFLGQSPVGSFHIDALPLTTLAGPVNCPLGSCSDVQYDTPSLTWFPVHGAGYYMVYLATDPLFTNITRTYTTTFTSLTPGESLPDSQAGQATYWFVRPCYTAGSCGPFDASVFDNGWAFRKLSRAVTDLTATLPAPASPGGPVDDSVVFSWRDYLVTNRTSAPSVDQEATSYNLQVSTTSNFTNIVDDVTLIDQTTYVSDTKTYPEGPLYARVRAYDHSNNPLTFSQQVSFTKSTPPPSGLAPNDGTDVSGTPLLSWSPMASAQQYDIEVYKNPDAPLSPTNLVSSVRTRLTTAVSKVALPSGTTYGWRVRRVDNYQSLQGTWSDLATFKVGGPAPVLIEPGDGRVVDNNSLLFQWTSVDEATRYRIDASTSATFQTVLQTATTDLTSWAPSEISPTWPNGTLYWRVSALDATGSVIGTSPTWSLVRDSGTAGEYTPVSPYRVLDTRISGGALGSKQTRTVTLVGGSTGIPRSGVSAVVANVTITEPTRPSYVTVWPAGVSRPGTSTVNFAAKQTLASHATIPVDTSGRASYFNLSGSVQVIIDVLGYYSGGTLDRGDRYTGAPAPARILDTRGGTSQPSQPLQPGESRVVEVAGLGGVPDDATAVVMNVTAVTPTRAGYLSVYPTGQPRPTASSVNFPAGGNVPNLVTMPLGTGGNVSVFNFTGVTHVVVDVVGWYLSGDPAPGSRFTPLNPARVADTRATQGPKLGSMQTRSFQVRGVAGVPDSSDVKAVVLTVTVTQPDYAGYLSVFASGMDRPTASNLNYVRGQTVSNQVIAEVGSDGRVNVFAFRSTHVVIDVVGWMG